MSTCKIKVQNFKTLLDSTKGITVREQAKGDREILKYIQLQILPDRVVATACNGYQLSQYTLTQSNQQQFTCYIKPFYFRMFQWMEDQEVEIMADEDSRITTVKVPASFGSISYEFKQSGDHYPILPSETLEKAKEHKNGGSVVAFNPALLSTSSKCFAKGRYSYMELFTPEDNLSPMYCKTKFSDNEILEHIILPVRRPTE